VHRGSYPGDALDEALRRIVRQAKRDGGGDTDEMPSGDGRSSCTIGGALIASVTRSL
jgi:hypothetical protein